MLAPSKRITRVQLPNGVTAFVEASTLSTGDAGKESDVAFNPALPLGTNELSAVLAGAGQVIKDAFAELRPTKGSVEFGIEIAVESGKLTGLFVQGTGNANLKITLEWSSPPAKPEA